MKYRAEKAANSESQAHNEPGGYLHWAFVGSPSFTTEWKEHVYTGAIAADQAGANTIAFNLSVFGEANTYYFDDIVWEIEESGNKIPQTPEEKADTLTWAMDRWIEGMMAATEGYVLDWDVVNEPFQVQMVTVTASTTFNRPPMYLKLMLPTISTGRTTSERTMSVRQYNCPYTWSR